MNLLNNKPDFSAIRLLVIGDVMLDQFIYTESNRMSPEYPVPVYSIQSKDQYPGGAANVATNILALGGQVELLSVIGGDTNGKHLTKLLETAGCKTQGLFQNNKRITTVKSRIFSNNKPVARLDDEQLENIDHTLQERIWLASNRLLEEHKIDGIILQDYNKGILTEALIKRLMANAKKHAVPVFVDPKVNNYKAYAGASIFKPNLKEISSFLGESLDTDLSALGKAAEILMKQVGFETLVLTLSEKGAYYHNQSKNGLIPTKPIENADVCGAGDSFIAALSLALCANLDINQAISLANKVSSVVCTKQGVQTCSYLEF